MRTVKIFFALSLSYYFANNILLFAQTPSVLPEIKHAPTIDGKIEAHEWPAALSLGSLQSVNGTDYPQTQAWMGWNEQHLLIAVRSREPQTGNIKTSVIADEKDGNVAADDCIQVLLDLGNSGSEFFQFIANTAGTYYDALFRNGSADVAAWDSNAIVRTYIASDYWDMEIAIPRHTLPQHVRQGDVIGLNIGRNRYVSGTLQIASLNKRPYVQIDQYLKKMIGGPVSGASVRLSSVQRGPFYQGQNGVWKFEIHSNNSQTITTRFPLDAKTPAKTHQLTPGLNQLTLEVPAAQLNRQNSLEVQQGGRTLYATQIPVRSANRPTRVAVTQNPLFRELLISKPDGLSREGTLFWGHDLSGPPHPLQLARRQGFEYSREKVLAALGQEQAIIISNSALVDSLSDEAARNSGVKIAVLLDARAAREKGAPTPAGSARPPWWQDPRTEAAYLEDVRKSIALAKTNPQVWGLMAGDETWEANDKTLKWFLDNGRETYPELMAAEREIKKKYGFGLPESSTDKNPFRWIATRRWEADRMLGLVMQVRDLIKVEAPHLRWVSWDNMAGHYPFAIGRWNEIFDIITGQLYPARDATRQNTAFNTQFLADISNSNEVWPVLHVEHYPASFTVAETEELLSQTFRGGATGLHLFPSDIIGRRAKKGAFGTDRIGAPERWNVLQQAFNTLKTPFRLKRPVADTAIFYSNTSYQGQPELQKTLEPEWMYTILGPRLKSAVRFIDETFITQNPNALQGFKTIYVPYAPIVDEAEFDALQQFVAGGGTLIVNDPLAFGYRSDGTRREGDALLPPLAATSPVKQTALTARNHQLRVLSEAYPLSAQNGEAIARYANGSVAAVQKSIGTGKVLFFGTNAIVQPVINNQQWLALFREIQTTAGAKLNQDVWRFRFPATPPFKRERPSAVCLTGNYMEWQLGQAVPTAAAPTGGHYLLSRKGGEAANQPIPFSEGRLTDRLKAIGAANDANPADFELQWTLDEPLEITYQFPQPVNLRQVRFFFARTLPAGSCQVSSDGQNWSEAGRWDERDVSVNEVALQEVRLTPTKATHLKVHFNAAPGKVLRLSETEVWGE